ncbi:MAG: hypothetical protein M3299_05090, partial [Thermoproteota archaeon]|nr:hypothetical protein [Thermoproteota archaeon]
MVSKPRNAKGVHIHQDKALDVSISLNESILRAIDSIRGDTNRSLWLRRAALKELERLKVKEKEKEQESKDGVSGLGSPTYS